MPYSEKNVLVLGGNGFIGKHLVKHLRLKEYRVLVIDKQAAAIDSPSDHKIGNQPPEINADICTLKHLHEVIDQYPIIFNLMGWTRHKLAVQNPTYDCERNIMTHIALIQGLLASKVKPKLLIYAGSVGQYGPSPTPQTEESPCSPIDPQGISKLAAEQYLKFFSKQLAFPCVSLRICNVFGEGMPTTGTDLGLIGDFIRDLHLGKQVEIYGESRAKDVIYIDDLVNVLISTIELKDQIQQFEVFNIPSHHARLLEICKIIKDTTGRGDFKAVTPQNNNVFATAAKSHYPAKKLMNLICNCSSLTPLDVALKRTIDWWIRYGRS